MGLIEIVGDRPAGSDSDRRHRRDLGARFGFRCGQACVRAVKGRLR